MLVQILFLGVEFVVCDSTMKLHIHIGSHKTGTTSIQQYLKRQRPDLIASNWIYPSSACMNGNAHHPLAYLLRLPDSKSKFSRLQELLGDIVNEANFHGVENIILSSEVFFSLSTDQIYQLKSLLVNHEVIVYAYLRRQDEFFHSFYMQCIKQSAIRFSDTAAVCKGFNCPMEIGDYASKLQLWSSVFGGDSVIARIYKKSLLSEGIIRDFVITLGIETTSLIPSRRLNRSIETELIEYLRINNSLSLPEETHSFILKSLNTLSAEHEAQALFLNRPYLSPDQAESMMNYYMQSNEILHEKYFPQLSELFDPCTLYDNLPGDWMLPELRIQTSVKIHSWMFFVQKSRELTTEKRVKNHDGIEPGSEMIDIMNA